MSTAVQFIKTSGNQLRSWSWLKKLQMIIAALISLGSCFLFLTPPGTYIRDKLAETVIMTQHREWAWIFVGAEKRDLLITAKIERTEARGNEPMDPNMIMVNKAGSTKNRTMNELIKVENISGSRWKGKKVYIYDPTTIRVVVPPKSGEGERISSMVKRTGAIAGINGGGFDDPDGLGNGFAPIGLIISGGDLLFTGYDSSVPQHVVGFTKAGIMIVGKYTIEELLLKNIKEAVTFDPRIIANGIPLITSGDGGSGIQPRTAVGQRADGVVIFIVIDGRQAASVGATEREVQDLFMNENVINAGFLDGGASSELVIKDEGLVTKPSSRYGERRLPTGFLVFDHPETYIAPRIWDGIDKINPGGAFDHPDFLKEQADLRRKGLLNTPVPTKLELATPTSSSTGHPNGSSTPANNAAGGGATQTKTNHNIGGVTPTTLPNPSSPNASKQPGTTVTPNPTLAPSSTAKPTSTPVSTPKPSNTSRVSNSALPMSLPTSLPAAATASPKGN